MTVTIAAVAMLLAVSISASAAARPDLVVPRANVPALQASAGASITVKVRVRNASRRKAARRSVVRLLLSGDARLGGDLILRPATRIGRLEPRKTSRRRMTWTLPGATAAGSSHGLAGADATTRVRERSERNNCRVVATVLVLGGATKPPAGSDIDHDGTPNAKDLDADDDGVPNTEDCLPFDPKSHPGAKDEPDAAGVDADCNGIDGHPVDGKDVFVWGGAPNDAGAGTRAAPRKTLTSAIALADQQGGDVYAATGTYAPPMLRTGVDVYGGYDPQTWARVNFHNDPDAPVTVVAGVRDGIYAHGIHGVRLQLLRVTALADLNKGRSVYGIRAANYSDLLLDAVDVRAGNGIGGVSGATGAPGGTGAKGGNGQPGLCDDGYANAFSPGPPWPRLLLASTPYDGESGAAAGAPANADGTPGTVKYFEYGYPPTGQGGSGAYEGGNNGSGAAPATGQSSGAWGGIGFGKSGDNGAVGPSGTVGSAGAGAAGGTANAGAAWAGMPGGSGNAGTAGGYGGGGGGGAGNDSGDDGSGAGGGAGGQGGKGGGGGKAGGFGGGSFGVYAYNHSNVTLAGATHITAGNGGKGGKGGEGGLGGRGGKGGLGGKSDCTPTEVGYGGNGGDGGSGGQGGAGGGGTGGPSIGVMLVGGSTVAGANTESMALGQAGFGGSSPAAGKAGAMGKRTYVLLGG